jgi:ATP-dependent protease ClpP protease subunit
LSHAIAAQARSLLCILLLRQRRLPAGSRGKILLHNRGPLIPRVRLRSALCAWALLLSVPVSGAELFYMDHDPYTDGFVGPIGPLVVSGEIVPGDYERLLAKILEDSNRFLSQNKIILASDGGDVAEALNIARLVKSLFTEIVVGPLTGRCVSACFFIFAAAGQREADGEKLIGINRPFVVAPGAAAALPTAAAAAAEGRDLIQVRAFLHDNAVPGYLVDEMFRRASDDAYWLSADDEKNLGYRSPWFNQYQRTKCAWDGQIELDVYAGKRPIDDLKPMLKCRDRVTQEAARQVLKSLEAKPR